MFVKLGVETRGASANKFADEAKMQPGNAAVKTSKAHFKLHNVSCAESKIYSKITYTFYC